MRSQRLYLVDILDCIGKIKDYIGDHNYEYFKSDILLQDAVMRNLEIIGEASRNLSQEVKLKVSAIDWQDIIAFRNVVAHEYFGVDLEIVWSIISIELDPLEDAILTFIDSPDFRE